MNDRAAAAELVRDVIDRRLLAVSEARYWYEGQRDDDAASLLDFWLHFEDKPALLFHGFGDSLRMELADAYLSYDMQESGEVIVGQARESDLLAVFVGQRLTNAALIWGYTSEPSVGGVRLRYEHDDLIVASLGDEWVLRQGPVPSDLREYLAVGPWLGGTEVSQHR